MQEWQNEFGLEMAQVFDLHCDLLSFLSGGARKPLKPRSAYDPRSRASIPQLIEGGVAIQTMAIYTPTKPWSVRSGLRQALIYKELGAQYPEPGKILTKLAIENASSLISEDESLEDGLARLEMICREVEIPLYVSLTWNEENRFGGGAHCSGVGLKPDGKVLLDWLVDKKIWIDLSHTSDALAHDILNHPKAKVIASHSNFRGVCNVPRNLPLEFAKEIAHRKGVIGLNVIKMFVGPTSDSILTHIEYAKKHGLADSLSIGADFFSELCIAKNERKRITEYFFPDLGNASRYPYLYEKVAKALGPAFASNFFFTTASNRL